MEEDEVGRECNMHGCDEKYIDSISWKILKEETTSKTVILIW
jgi:hypothetical protein